MEPAHLLYAVPLPAILISPSHHILASNRDAVTLLGPNRVGRHYSTMVRQPDIAQAIEATLRDQQDRETEFLRNDGTQDQRYWVTCRWVAGSVLVCFNDISRVEQAEHMRRDFVANVSHELKTPLTTLTGFIETLKGPAKDDSAARARFLGIMADEAARMNRLVDDLLSLSRVEGEARIRPTERVKITELVQSVLSSLRPMADAAKVTFETDFEAPPAIVLGDSDQLRQVFTNLIENAIKYGGSGGIVAVRIAQISPKAGQRGGALSIEVRDQGPGIAPVHLPRLTERFYRADHHRARDLGGTGLGLAIVKHIVNRHRGRLHIDSTLGQGATFRVTLPTENA